MRPQQVQKIHDDQPLRLLATRLQQHMRRFGYQLIETPIIENAELFLTKAGDKVAERLFRFERHGQLLALRPEFTAAAAHLYLQQGDTRTIARWQFSGPVFEDNPGDPLRRYQQLNAGAELIGKPGPAAEAEIIDMALTGLSEHGIEDWEIVIGHVGLTQRLLSRYNLDPRTQHFILSHRHLLKDGDAGREQLLALIRQYLPDVTTLDEDIEPMTQANAQEMLDLLLNTSRSSMTMGGRSRHDIAQRLLRKRRQAAQKAHIDDALYFLQRWMAIRSTMEWALDDIEDFIHQDGTARTMLDEWRSVLSLLKAYEIPTDRITLEPDLARTWDYYTGVVFEVRTSEGVHLAGGGRYNELTRLIGGDSSIPAVGFAYYVDSILDVIATPPKESDRMVKLMINSDQQASGARWAANLRKRGICVILAETADEGGATPLTLELDADGNVCLGERKYQLADIDLLVSTLNG